MTLDLTEEDAVVLSAMLDIADDVLNMEGIGDVDPGEHVREATRRNRYVIATIQDRLKVLS